MSVPIDVKIKAVDLSHEAAYQFFQKLDTIKPDDRQDVLADMIDQALHEFRRWLQQRG